MTIAGYNLGGDLDLCAREIDKAKFLDSVKRLALQRNVSERTIMIWCYQRVESQEALDRIKNWIQEEDQTQRWVMSLPEIEILE
ncbi:MAG: hypothetical protein SFU25_08650 [Candidatus Caenarcaniphilales bacterium]|nr:hypothetical protein [Candidatus Caenarcaniphilales bacterium]